MKYPMINVRCSAEEKAAIDRVASSRGMTLSKFMRSLLREQISAAQPPVTASGGAAACSSPDVKG